jgi:hypothetical protein
MNAALRWTCRQSRAKAKPGGKWAVRYRYHISGQGEYGGSAVRPPGRETKRSGVNSMMLTSQHKLSGKWTEQERELLPVIPPLALRPEMCAIASISRRHP